MGRPPKCKICGKILDINSAFVVIKKTKTGNDVKSFYCNEEEYNSTLNKTSEKPKSSTSNNKKRKTNPNTDKVYYLVCEILGEEKILNTILWKEKKLWNMVADDKIIGDYLEENKEWLITTLYNVDGTEYSRIRYLSAIIKNNIQDYKNENKNPPIKKQINMEYFENEHNKKSHKRRSMEELEEEI